MEEQKKNKVAEERPIKGKLSYEQLNGACIKMSQQIQYYENQIKGLQKEIAGLANMFTRLDYLFKVVENADKFKDPEFVNICLDEIKTLMTLKEKLVEEKEEDKEK